VYRYRYICPTGLCEIRKVFCGGFSIVVFEWKCLELNVESFFQKKKTTSVSLSRIFPSIKVVKVLSGTNAYTLLLSLELIASVLLALGKLRLYDKLLKILICEKITFKRLRHFKCIFRRVVCDSGLYRITRSCMICTEGLQRLLIFIHTLLYL